MMQKMKADSLARSGENISQTWPRTREESMALAKAMIAFCAEAIETGTCQAPKYLERETGSQLDLSRRRRGFGDGSELWRVHKAIRRSQIRVVKRIESFSANLKLNLLGD